MFKNVVGGSRFGFRRVNLKIIYIQSKLFWGQIDPDFALKFSSFTNIGLACIDDMARIHYVKAMCGRETLTTPS